MHAKTLDELKTEAENVGMEYLSAIATSSNDYARYRCKKCGAESLKMPKKIRQGQHCAICQGLAPKTIKTLKDEAEKAGLIYIDLKPSSDKSKALYQCKKCGYQWLKRPGNVHNGSGCRICNRKGRNRKTLVELKKDAEKINMEYCESKIMLSHEKTRYRCKKCKNISVKTPFQIQRGNGCSICFGNAPRTLKKLQEEAEKVNIEYVDKDSIHGKSKAKYKCKVCGKKFQKRPGSVYLGSGCPYCKIKKQENICHCFFEKIFNVKFKQHISPKWLLGKNGHFMHLDGYCEELRVAFEYNGIDHFDAKSFHNSLQENGLEKQQERDLTKAQRCNEHNFVLIVVPYTIKPDQMQDYIINEYRRLSGHIIESERLNWKSFDLRGYRN